MRERTKLVIVLAKPGAAEVRHTVEIAEAYKRSFGQEAVLRTITRRPACRFRTLHPSTPDAPVGAGEAETRVVSVGGCRDTSGVNF